MKPSVCFSLLALVAPITASPKYSKNTWEQQGWKTSTKHKKEHHHKTSTAGLGPSLAYPSLAPTGGYSGSPTGTGGLNPTHTPLPTPLNNSPAGNQAEAGDGSPPSPSGSPSQSDNSSTVSIGNVQLPAGCGKRNNIGIGWLPGPGEKIGDMNSALGFTACFDGQYAQITETGPYSDSKSQLTPSIGQLTGGQTIFVASVMPSIALSSVDSTVAGGVANVLKQFTDKNIEVWLRFAHEVNWYVTDGTYHGSVDDFQQAWGAISAAVESNNLIKMFWSPNQASSGDLQQWFPTKGHVDVVGIDIYPKSQKSFGEVYGDFCKTFSTAKNLPFVIGETGAGPDFKEQWLREIVKGDPDACPKYLGWSYFDYNKEADFRVVDGSDIAKRVLG